MNLIEAMRRSKETGERFRRPFYPKGWYQSAEDYDDVTYEELTLDDILAEDWEAVPETGSRKPCPTCCKRECICAQLDAWPTPGAVGFPLEQATSFAGGLWRFERSSGYDGWRCLRCAAWRYGGEKLQCDCQLADPQPDIVIEEPKQ